MLGEMVPQQVTGHGCLGHTCMPGAWESFSLSQLSLEQELGKGRNLTVSGTVLALIISLSKIRRKRCGVEYNMGTGSVALLPDSLGPRPSSASSLLSPRHIVPMRVRIPKSST